MQFTPDCGKIEFFAEVLVSGNIVKSRVTDDPGVAQALSPFELS